jgi:hypothetical protein
MAMAKIPRSVAFSTAAANSKTSIYTRPLRRYVSAALLLWGINACKGSAIDRLFFESPIA